MMSEDQTHYFGDDCPDGHMRCVVVRSSDDECQGEVKLREVNTILHGHTELPICEGHVAEVAEGEGRFAVDENLDDDVPLESIRLVRDTGERGRPQAIPPEGDD